MRRYHIRLGDKTTADGVVETASSCISLNGSNLALEGDRVSCPACGTEGVIQVVQPRISECFNGKELALGDDLCVCRCSPPPKLISAQTGRFQTILDDGELVEKAQEEAKRQVSDKAEERIPIRFYDEGTNKPCANRHYRIKLKSGRVLEGTTDGDGCTMPLTKDERDALTAWNLTAGA